MTDRGKILKGLEYCGKGCNPECPYWDDFEFDGNGLRCMRAMRHDALTLLKEQEKSKKCKYCGRDIGKNWAWCAWCGRTVNYCA